MLRSDSCYYSHAYIAVREKISVQGDNDDKTRNKKLIFKDNAPFRSCMSKINNTFRDNVEDRDIVTPMYNLLKYSDNYSMTSESLWNYYRDVVNDDENENDNTNNNRINNNKTTVSKSFEYKTKIIGTTPADNNKLIAEAVVPLKHLSSFSRFLDLPSIDCETERDLSWSKSCIISEISIRPRIYGNPDGNPPV